MKDYFLLAWKNLRRRRLRSWLTILGIFIGVAAVVALISVGQSLSTSIASQFGDLEPDKITIENVNMGFGSSTIGTTSPLDDDTVKLIERNSKVKYAFGQYVKPMQVTFNDITQMGYVVSLPMDSGIQSKFYEPVDIYQGKFIGSTDRGKIVLGSMFQNKDYFGKNIKIGDYLDMNKKKFKVAGILESTGKFTMNMAILMLEDDYEEKLIDSNDFTTINVYIKDIKQADEVAEELRIALRKDRNEKQGEESFSITTSQANLDSINSILNIVNIIVIAIAAIALLIGGIGVANTMFTSVLERQGEIGIQKAIGASNLAIGEIFLFESGLLCLFGGVLGALFGLFISWGITSVASLIMGGTAFKITASWTLLFGSALFSFIIGLIAGYVPARKAAKMSPVEAFRR